MDPSGQDSRIPDNDNINDNNNNNFSMILALQGQRTGPLVINSVPVQQQIGGSDCGVFAVAYLIELLHGHDPSKSRFIQKQMRNHMLQCSQSECWKPFPKGGGENKCSAQVGYVIQSCLYITM